MNLGEKTDYQKIIQKITEIFPLLYQNAYENVNFT